MSRKTTGVSAKYGGKRVMVNKETGEIEEVQVIKQNMQMDINFHKVWVTHLSLALDLVGNVKTKILSYLIKEAGNNNMIIKTQKEIADELNISRPSVNETIKILREANIIETKVGVIMLNPDIVAKGSHVKRMRILHDYENINPKNKDNNVTPGQTSLEEHIKPE